LNIRLLMGLALILLGILVFAFPEFLRLIVGAGLILVGLYIALQNAPASSTNI